MKFIIITIALVAAPLFAAGVQAERIPVMDQKNGAAHSRDSRADERYSGRDHGKKPTGEGLSSGKSSDRRTGTAHPEKKSRLKYRDDPRCSC